MRSLAAEFPNDNPALHRGAIWVVMHPLAVPVAEAPEPEIAAEGEIAPPATVVAAAAPEPIVAEEVLAEEIAPATIFDPTSLLEEIAVEIAASRPSGIIAIPPDAHLDTFEIEDDGEADVIVEELEPLLLTETIVDAEVAPAPLESEVVLVTEAANDVTSSTSLPPPPDDPFTVLLATLTDVAVAAGSPHVASVLPALLLEGRLDELTEDARAALTEGSILDGAGVSAGFTKTLEAWKAILRGTSDDFDATGGVMLDEWAAGLLARMLGTPAKSELLRRDLRSRGVAAFGLAA